MNDMNQLLPREAGVGQEMGEDPDLMEVMVMPVGPNLNQVLRLPNNVMVDLSPLQPQLQKNKESLEKKLLARRPMTTLVEQGIVPEYKTSPSLHLQRTKLERAKTGDILKSKISLRPERTELVHRHILEDVRSDVDPSLCDRQRQLKRAKLADSLASQLSHRPGPLELIRKNILHTDETVETAVKEGTLTFRATSEDALSSRGQPGTPVIFDEDSSDTAPSPAVDTGVLSPASGHVTRDTSSPSVTSLLAQFSDINSACHRSLRSESLGDITSVSSPRRLPDTEELIKCDIFGGSGGNLSVAGHDLFTAPNQHRDAPGKERKKLKAKKPGTAPKPTSFKFHEYKGPPESLKRKKPEKKKDRNNFDLQLEQQQLLLQWQVENKNKFQLLLPAPVKGETGRSSTMSVGTSSTSGYMSGASSSCASSLVTSPTNSVPGTPRSATPREATPTRFSSLTPADVNNATSLLHKLDAMKVNDLKLELKKRNLPISGSKPQLIEKLKPALEAVIAAGKKQFKQPYKQIQIASGGLIILKPSPNSQLLTSTEAKEKTPEAVSSPASMHEGTPEMDEVSNHSLTPLMLPMSSMAGDLSLLGLLSPSESVHSLGTNSEIETILSGRRDSLHSLHSNTTDTEFPLSFMEVEPGQAQAMPPPAPPPPPPPQARGTKEAPLPQPLPGPPGVASGQAPPQAQQFFPPKQTSQQILLAKAALEAQLTAATDPKSQLTPGKSSRAGPKGQFIWPPVSVQSSQGTMITIRAMNGDTTMVSEAPAPAPPVRNETVMSSSKPVSQLAAVFSQSPDTNSLPMFVRLPQEPVPASELGLTVSTASSNNLPATLPSQPQGNGALVSDNSNSVSNDTGDSLAGLDIIKAQQQRIAELEALVNQQQGSTTLQQLQLQQSLLDFNQGAQQLQQQQPQPPSIINTKHLLAQQIHNKHLNMNTAHRQQDHDQSMDDVIDSLFNTEDLPESVQHFGVKVPEKPPNPPPLPAKQSPTYHQFPQLDLAADMSFDFGLGSELEGILGNNSISIGEGSTAATNNYSCLGPTNVIGSIDNNGVNGGQGMDVDLEDDVDVQDWLDSLVVPINSKLHPDLSTQYKEKKGEMNNWAGHGV